MQSHRLWLSQDISWSYLKIKDGGDQRIDLRDLIFLEVIGSAVVHREYTSALSTNLITGKNKVTTINPNKALFHGPIDPSSFNSQPKNLNIRKFFTSFGVDRRDRIRYSSHYEVATPVCPECQATVYLG